MLTKRLRPRHHKITFELRILYESLTLVFGLGYTKRQDSCIMHELYTIAEVFQEAMVLFLKIYGSVAFLEDANFSYHGKESIKDKTPN
jgi:hypothetical protein